jgi:hypothetical protein
MSTFYSKFNTIFFCDNLGMTPFAGFPSILFDFPAHGMARLRQFSLGFYHWILFPGARSQGRGRTIFCDFIKAQLVKVMDERTTETNG